MKEIPPEVWVEMAKYLLSILCVALLAYYGLKYGLKDAREKLYAHMDSDTRIFLEIDVKLGHIQDGIANLRDHLGEHHTQLSLHDERTKQTAETLAKMGLKLTAVNDKLDAVRLNQERLSVKLEERRRA